MVLAVNGALQVISWFENLPKDEQPPRQIWWSDELLDDWFKNVEQERRERSGQSSKKRSPYDEADDVPMSENELIDREQYLRGING
jgi:hypothetical protein